MLCTCAVVSASAQEVKVRKSHAGFPLGAYIYAFDEQGIDSTLAGVARYEYNNEGEIVLTVTASPDGMRDSSVSFYDENKRISRRIAYQNGIQYSSETWTYDTVQKTMRYLIEADDSGMPVENRILYIGVKDFNVTGSALTFMETDINLLPCDTIISEMNDGFGTWTKNLEVFLYYTVGFNLPTSGKVNLSAILNSLPPGTLDSLPIALPETMNLTFTYNTNKDLTRVRGTIAVTILPFMPPVEVDVLNIFQDYDTTSFQLVERTSSIGLEVPLMGINSVFRSKDAMTYEGERILSHTMFTEDSVSQQMEKTQSTWYFYDLSVDQITQENLSLHPNPANSYITVQTTQPAELCIYDLAGKTVLNKHITRDEKISVEHLPSGFYLVCLRNRHGIRSAKLVIGR